MFRRTDSEIISLFYSANTREDIANMLEIEDISLRFFLFKVKPENMYTSFQIRKKSGGYRRISSPIKKLKSIQRKLTYVLSLVHQPKVCSYGFENNKNIVKNAMVHSNKRLILNIDLENFFNQVHFGRVRGLFVSPPYSIGLEAATTIAQLCCFNGKLPQGAPTSPIITNMICRPLDNQLLRLAKKNHLTYTRYADDLTFSTNKKILPDSIVNTNSNKIEVGYELATILDKNSFSVNADKIFLNDKYTRQEVTGLTVNKFPNVRREYIKNLRAIMHSASKYGVIHAAKKYIFLGNSSNNNIRHIINTPSKEHIVYNWFKSVLTGKILFLRQVRGDDDFLYLKYASELNKLFNEAILDVTKLNIFHKQIENNVFILEFISDDNWIQGSGFLLDGYGLLTNYHVVESENFFKVFKHTKYDINFEYIISLTSDKIRANKEIDYALLNVKDSKSSFKVNTSNNIYLGMKVTLIGFPNHVKGNSPYIDTCEVTSHKSFYHGSDFYTLSGRVGHGASGGVVLNEEKEVIGLLKGGIVSMDDEATNEMQGFVSITSVLNHIDS